MTTFFGIVTEMLDRIERDPRWRPTERHGECPRCFVGLVPHMTPPGPGVLPKLTEWCPRCDYRVVQWGDSQ